MSKNVSKIIWTKIDEAPALASYSLLPVVNAFTNFAGILVEPKDISLAGRIIAAFPEKLSKEQRLPDYLAELGELTQKPEANIIKLPNISASVPQLKNAVKELQEKGFNLPDYPENPINQEQQEIKNRYSKILGSAVNPVLREGNSDRRSALSVKLHAKKNPHKMMKEWPKNSKSHVAHMSEGDFYENEKSVVTEKSATLKIQFVNKAGKIITLKDELKTTEGEIIDGTYMNKDALREFYKTQFIDAKNKNLLMSLHLKATMMKVSDPILFGHAVSIYYKDVFDKYPELINELGVNVNYGIGDLYSKLENLPEQKRNEIEKEIQAVYDHQAKQAMVDSDKGITNLHVPNNIIIDASMPNVIRDGGRMWGPDGKLADTKAIIPDRCYATIYQAVIDDCNKNGAFNPASMGSVSNVGLMAQKAEEYGSHPTTFEIPEDGKVQVIANTKTVLFEHEVSKGDIWRMSRVKDIPVKDWVKLAVNRARITNSPAVFWLDKNRAHDSQLIQKVNKYLQDHETGNLEMLILAPKEAMKFTLEKVRKGEDVIAVTGNVLRDYLTDLFPILELGTSAKMLSIVPLLSGGGLFETGAGGSAPKHVMQFLSEGHLRWDSLGEFLALTASLDHLSQTFNNKKAKILADSLDKAVGKYLENGKSPSRVAGELDNRGTHFFLAKYWAETLSEQNDDAELKEKFQNISKLLNDNESVILKEIANAEGKPTEIGGYYYPDNEKAEKAMRPSETFNNIIDHIN